TSTKLAAARKRKFLFLNSQKLTPRVNHLHYKKSGSIPVQTDYNIKIPTFDSEKSETISSLFSPTPYCPIPDMFFPLQYRNIIPPDPIYDEYNNFIIPGSRNWFTYMYNLSKSHIANQKAKARDPNEVAAYHGTTRKHLTNRMDVVNRITTYNNTYDRIMTTYRNSALQKLSRRKLKNLNTEMDYFFSAHPYAIHDHHRHSEKLQHETVTSDDTKEVEMHPLKRDIYVSSSMDGARNMSKRICSDSTLASDSKQAGSLQSTNTN
ncbi:11498_t:CDS:1, partial [Rhizophagus irregularis]